MGRILHILGFFAVLALQTGAAGADGQITVVVQEMPGLVEPGKTLPYNRLLNDLLEEAPGVAGVDILPGYRGPRLWLRHEYQCIFGGVSVPGHKRPRDTAISPTDWSTLHISMPFNLLKVHVFSRPDTEPAHKLDALKGRKIAVDQVLFFDLRFHSDALKESDFVKVDTAREALVLLDHGRVDHVFAYDNDVALMQDETHASFAYDPGFTLLELEESMMCWSGGEAAALVNHVNEKLAEMQRSGILENLVPRLR